MKQIIKQTFIFFIFYALSTLIIALLYFFTHLSDVKFSTALLNTVFYSNLIIFIISALMFMSERKFFNAILYSAKHFAATVSSKSRLQITASHNITSESEIKNFLKERYLYAEPKYKYTYPLFITSSTMFILIILYISYVYGI